jgi:hypothetical protein
MLKDLRYWLPRIFRCLLIPDLETVTPSTGKLARKAAASAFSPGELTERCF